MGRLSPFTVNSVILPFSANYGPLTSEEQTFECEYCLKQSNWKSNFKRHMHSKNGCIAVQTCRERWLKEQIESKGVPPVRNELGMS